MKEIIDKTDKELMKEVFEETNERCFQCGSLSIYKSNIEELSGILHCFNFGLSYLKKEELEMKE